MRTHSTAVTLHDLARAAGVSVNTVSRALTGKSDISAATKARVLSLADRLGYRPNLMARSLVQGRTRSIGLVVTDCTHPFYATLIRAVEETAFSTGYSLLLSTSSDSADREASALHLLTERRVDGLLVSPVQVATAQMRDLLNSPTPKVLLTRRPTGYKGPFVGTDNILGARLAMRHLKELGHHRIAHVTTTHAGGSDTARLRGYRNELAGADLVVSAPQTIEGGRMIVADLLRGKTPPTAVFTYNDLQAIGVMLGLRAAGVRVPEDLSVIGFDGIDIGEITSPPLTTVAQQIDQIGRLGAQLLIDSLEGRTVGKQVNVLAPKLIVRGSTGPAR
jgi:LacI family transcriptional regulator